MLDRSKVLKELQILSDQLFSDFSGEYNRAREIWESIARDTEFAAKLQTRETPWPVPRWSGFLDEVVPVSTNLSDYTVISVDGSQIYPDRHQGTPCFLINIGKVLLRYGAQSSCFFQTLPYVFTGEEAGDGHATVDLVNCRRQEYEWHAGCVMAKEVQPTVDHPLAVFFDGSLIFWHLDAKDSGMKKQFLHRYLQALDELAQSKILCAGYISLPKNKELVNLIRAALCDCDKIDCPAYSEVDHVVDTAVAGFFLQPGTRSIVFESRVSLADLYPPPLKPHFFYLHTGDEVARVEVPAWIANDRNALDRVATLLLDQAKKGRGYPVALAEAHEQAVVKGPDREFFYHCITKIGFEQKRQLLMSPKSIKKRGIGI